MEDVPHGPGEATDFVAEAPARRPDLIVYSGDLTATARALRDLFAASGRLFDRGVPVRITQAADGGPPTAQPLTPNSVVVEAHCVSRPVKYNEKGEPKPVTLPDRVARIYLDMVGEWNLPPLMGVTTVPLLTDDGAIRTAAGYDAVTGLWCSGIPDVGPMVPMTPTRQDAESALHLVRGAFKTFPFSDSKRLHDPALGVGVVDLEQPPGADESTFLLGLQTAVSRASLELAPGLIVNAPAISGAGAGKGLLVRAICAIAFGIRPRAFTTGGDRQEFDKRLVAELIEASPVLFVDNANGVTLNSSLLASVMTERPARARILGESRMAELNSIAWVAVTGNAVAPSSDNARRFIVCGLDPECEDPEARPFKPGFLEEIQARRVELLSALLTIWRWGRQNAADLKLGRALGSFERWATWCRDPLLALGCLDPVDRIAEAKARDPRRLHIVAIFDQWWRHHKSAPMKAGELADEVIRLIDPQGRGRQFVAAGLGKLAGTRAGGFALTRQKGAGQWSVATYALQRTTPETMDGVGHKDHGGHGAGTAKLEPHMPPTPRT